MRKVSDIRVLIGIATFRRPEYLRRLLIQLQEQSQDGSVHVVVVDNDPERSAAAVCNGLLEAKGWTYTNELRPGVSHVRNRILEFFTVDFDALIMIDDDQELGDRWLEGYIRALSEWPNEILSGGVRYVFPEGQPASYVYDWYRARRGGAEGSIVRSTGTGNSCLPRSVWEEAGMPHFDPRFGLLGGEDTDFFARIANQGVTIRRVRSASVNELVERDRASVDWVRRRTVRQGEIRGAMADFGNRSMFGILQGLARMTVGLGVWCSEALAGRAGSRRAESKFLTGIGYVKGSLGLRSQVYGGSR